MFDALPLAAEPWAAAFDLVCSAVGTGFARGPADCAARVAAFPLRQRRRRAAGGRPTWRRSTARWPSTAISASCPRCRRWSSVDGSKPGSSGRACRGRSRAGQVLVRLATRARRRCAPPAADGRRTCDVLLAFLTAHEAAPGPDDPLRARQLRARAAHPRHAGGAARRLRAASIRRRSSSTTPPPCAAAGSRPRPSRRAPATAACTCSTAPARASATSTTCSWPAWSRASGRTSRGAASSTRRPSCASWAGRPTQLRLDGVRAEFADLLRLPARRAHRVHLRARSRRAGQRLVAARRAGARGLDAVEEALPRRASVRARGARARSGGCRRALDAGAASVGRAAGWPRRGRAELALPRRDRGPSGARLLADGARALSDCPFKFFAADVLRPRSRPTTSRRRRRARAAGSSTKCCSGSSRRGTAPGTARLRSDTLDRAREVAAEAAAPLLERARRRRRRARARAAVRLRHLDRAHRPRAGARSGASGRPVVERWLEHRFDGAFALGAEGARGRPQRRGRPRRPAAGPAAARDRLQVGPRARREARAAGGRSTRCARRRRWRARDGGPPWTVHEAAYVALGGAKRTLVPVVEAASAGRRGDAARRPRPAAGGARRHRAAASSRPGRSSRAGAATAPTPRSAARTTSTMSSGRARLPFDDGRRASLDVAHRRARPRGARAGRRSPLQRRARGLGRHRQDARAGGPLPQPAEGGRGPVAHPGDDLHAEGRHRNARPHPGVAPRGGRARRDSAVALARAARPHRRHRGQHDRRLLPVAAARVPARGRPRSRLLDGRRDRGAASHRRIARPRAARLPRGGARGRERGAGVRAAGRSACEGGTGRRCSAGGWSRPRSCAATSRRAPPEWTVATVAGRGAAALRDVFGAMRGGLDAFLASGPAHSRRSGCWPPRCGRSTPAGRYARRRRRCTPRSPARAGYFLTQDGKPRRRSCAAPRRRCSAPRADYERHRDLVIGHAPAVVAAHAAYRRDLNVLVARGVWRMFAIAERHYRDTLDAHAVLDFPDVLLYTLRLLGQMEEFSQSRYRLESRYHHVLVDEFQDTSRAQWELVSLLVQCVGRRRGAGLSGAARAVGLHRRRPQAVDLRLPRRRRRRAGRGRAAPSRSCGPAATSGARSRAASGRCRRCWPSSTTSAPISTRCRRGPTRSPSARTTSFPLDADASPSRAGARAGGGRRRRGVRRRDGRRDCRAAWPAARPCATARPACPGRSGRATSPSSSARARATASSRTRSARVGLPSYVYKGLGFFDADEIKDVLALLWYLADPSSDLRAAAFLRSRFVRLSDEGAAAARARAGRGAGRSRSGAARPAARRRRRRRGWRRPARRRRAGGRSSTACRRPSWSTSCCTSRAYGVELRGPRFAQARENLKKFRALLRRIQNRGYATLGRIASHLDRLAVGRRVERLARRHQRRQPDDRARGQGPRVPGRLRREPGARHRQPPRLHPHRHRAGRPARRRWRSATSCRSPTRTRRRASARRPSACSTWRSTRARDRLYLSSVLKDGRIAPGRGSLAEVLPPALLDVLRRGRGGAAGRVARRAPGTRARLPRVRVPAAEPAVAAGSPAAPRSTRPRQPTICCRLPRPALGAPRRRRSGVGRRAPARDVGEAAGSRVGAHARHRRPPAAAGARHVGGARGRRRGRARAAAACGRTRRVALADRDRFAVARGRGVPRAVPPPRGSPLLRGARTSCTRCRSPCRTRAPWCAAPSTVSCRVSPGEVAVLEFKTGRPRARARRAGGALRLGGGAAVSWRRPSAPKLIYTELGAFP